MDVVELAAGPDRVVVDPEAGGRLASLIAGGRERLVGPPADDSERLSTLWGCFPMVPWAGRIAEGRLEWEGKTHQLRRNHDDHSIHGVVFDVPWKVIEADEGRVSLTTDELPGWPFGGSANQTIQLREGLVVLRLEVVARAGSMPAWIGWHPWLKRPDEGDMTVLLRSDKVLETRPDLIPTGRLLDVAGPTDLRAGPALGDRRLDHVYVEVTSPVRIAWPDLELTMEFERPYRTVVVHTPEAGVCVEPQTAWPDAAALEDRGVVGTGLRRLEPGAVLTARAAWHWS
jgi:aldose 1-epimerase